MADRSASRSLSSPHIFSVRATSSSKLGTYNRTRHELRVDMPPPTAKIQTAQPVYQSSFSSPTSSLPEFDFEKRYQSSEKESPTGSTRQLYKSSPLQSAISPDLLHTKPWPERPQLLTKGIERWRWWDFAVDSVMLMLPLPFFILITAAIAVDNSAITAKSANFLDLAIKGVSEHINVPVQSLIMIV